MRRGLLIAALLCCASTARAYPQYVAKGYTNCGTCHYSATGGGLPNAYGHATLEATFPNDVEIAGLQKVRDWLTKGFVTGYGDDGNAALQWDAGLDARLLMVSAPSEAGGSDGLLVVPMLLEAGAVAGYGPVLAYGTVTPRRFGAERGDLSLFSREHWLQYRLAEGWSLRAGRMVLPFGLRMADHTHYTREDLRFDKWQQSYALQLDAANEAWAWSTALFGGDLLATPSELQERGAATSFTWNFPGRGSVGGSLLYATHTLGDRAAASLFTRLRLAQGLYCLGEVALYEQRSTDGKTRQPGIAGMARTGWFLLESLDLYLEVGVRRVADAQLLDKLRYSAGAEWQLLPWVAIAPAVLFEENRESGMTTTLFGQLHVIY